MFPLSFCRVPVKCILSGSTGMMEFIAGMMAIEQEPDSLALRPRIGWMVGLCED
jgi:hypothetical protein